MHVNADEDFSPRNVDGIISMVLATSQQVLNDKDARLPACPSAGV